MLRLAASAEPQALLLASSSMPIRQTHLSPYFVCDDKTMGRIDKLRRLIAEEGRPAIFTEAHFFDL